jgi:hypothetical protein
VIHDLSARQAADALFAALYEIAPEHWPVTAGAVLADTGVSPAYLREHLLRSLEVRGQKAGLLLVTRLCDAAAWANLPAEGEAWLREVMAEGG